MTRPRLLALAAILVSGVALPASAQWLGPGWDRIGTVSFSSRPTVDVQYARFGGRVGALALRARDSDATCRRVTAVFANGRTRDIFRGYLPRGEDVLVDLPGPERRISQLVFDCRAMARRGTRVDIAADIGPYRAEWRRSPDWERVWSRIFRWDDVPGTGRYVAGELDPSGWIPLGTERFEGRLDHEMTFAGWRGRDVGAIALRPFNEDVRCRHVTVTFANGATRRLDVNEGDIIPRNRITPLDIPGFERDVTRIDMNCFSVSGLPVTMQVLAAG